MTMWDWADKHAQAFSFLTFCLICGVSVFLWALAPTTNITVLKTSDAKAKEKETK